MVAFDPSAPALIFVKGSQAAGGRAARGKLHWYVAV